MLLYKTQKETHLYRHQSVTMEKKMSSAYDTCTSVKCNSLYDKNFLSAISYPVIHYVLIQTFQIHTLHIIAKFNDYVCVHLESNGLIVADEPQVVYT